MKSMDPSFLTIAEAAEKTGRSPSTLRRVIRAIGEHAKHVDRNAVIPTPDEVKAFKKKGENFTWKIREDILMKHFEGAPVDNKKTLKEAAPNVMHILQQELEIKNNQIEKQMEVIQSLNERLREGNILMGALQKQLSLPAPDAPKETVVEATSTKSSAKDIKEASKKVTRKGLFGWLKRDAVRR